MLLNIGKHCGNWEGQWQKGQRQTKIINGVWSKMVVLRNIVNIIDPGTLEGGTWRINVNRINPGTLGGHGGLMLIELIQGHWEGDMED